LTVGETRSWDLIVELHGTANKLLAGLPWPQKVSFIAKKNRSRIYTELEGLGNSEKLLSEYREASQSWIWCDGATNVTQSNC
jgi:hypothetical protein